MINFPNFIPDQDIKLGIIFSKAKEIDIVDH